MLIPVLSFLDNTRLVAAVAAVVAVAAAVPVYCRQVMTVYPCLPFSSFVIRRQQFSVIIQTYDIYDEHELSVLHQQNPTVDL